MARFETTASGWLNLRPSEYQFPSINGNEYDDNWLDIEFEASFEPRFSVSRRSAPAFLTWELHWFIQSSRELVQGSRDNATLVGLEPNLSLETRMLSSDLVSVKVAVALSFAPYAREPFDEPFQVTVKVPTSSFLRFIDGLERELASFPERTA